MAVDPVLGRATFALRNRLEDLPLVQQAIDRVLHQHAIEQEPAYVLRLAVEELLSNVMRHGFDDTSLHQIVVAVEVRTERIDLTIEDDGRAFDPNSRGDLPTPATLEDAPIGGMGLAMVKQMAGPIHYVRQGMRNRVTVQIPRQGRRYS